MATTGKRVVSVSHRKPKRDRAQKIRAIAPTDAELHEGIMGAAREMGLEVVDKRPREVTDGVAVVRLDPALLDMLRGYVETIRKVYPDVWDVPSWDGMIDTEEVHAKGGDIGLEFAHAIGGIAGAAAVLDLTPCMLIDNLGL